MKISWLVLLAVSLLIGCMHTHYLTPETPVDSVRVMNQRIAPYRGFVTKRSGEYYYGKNIQIRDSVTLWKNTNGDKSFMLPNEQIKRIIAQDRMEGIIEGMEYGALTGAAFGTFIVGIASAMIPRHQSYNAISTADTVHYPGGIFYDKVEKREPILGWFVAGVLGGAIVGTTFGIIVGYGGGSKIEIQYKFPAKTK
jgi:hypothetical protein